LRHICGEPKYLLTGFIRGPLIICGRNTANYSEALVLMKPFNIVTLESLVRHLRMSVK